MVGRSEYRWPMSDDYFINSHFEEDIYRIQGGICGSCHFWNEGLFFFGDLRSLFSIKEYIFIDWNIRRIDTIRLLKTRFNKLNISTS